MAGNSWWRVTPRGEGNWVPFIVVGVAMGVGFTVEEEGWDGVGGMGDGGREAEGGSFRQIYQC